MRKFILTLTFLLYMVISSPLFQIKCYYDEIRKPFYNINK